MTDRITRAARSDLMGRVKSKDTRPELIVRRLLFALGIRYRLHRPDLPGRPDITLAGRRTVVFVHGCLWHQHPNCHRAKRPASNVAFWNAKLDRNVKRDHANVAALRDLGWSVLVVWECETHDLSNLENGLKRRFGMKFGRGGTNARRQPKK